MNQEINQPINKKKGIKEYIKGKNKKMHGVGFEPTSIATPHLECGPLDRSGIRASPMYSLSFLSNNTNLITLIIYFIQ